MLNKVLVKFDDFKFNYFSSVNALSKFESLHRYFVGQTFFMGSDDTQESDPNMWQTCREIILFKTEFIVISGSFKGETGTIRSKMLNDLYMLDISDGSAIAVTSSQIVELNEQEIKL